MSKEIIRGVDVGAFVPWLGILSGAMGGGGKPQAGDSEAVKMMKVQLEQQERARREADARMKMVLFGVAGVGAFTLLYLLLKK